VGQQLSTVEVARAAVEREAWAEAYSLLRGLAEADVDVLTPVDFDALSDAAWWLCRVDESIEARLRAYAGHVAAGADRAAGSSAWMVFYEHHLAGRSATAAGWLARARRHLDAAPDCPEQAYLAFADVFLAQERGDLEHALASARLMTVIAHRCGSPDLRAMGQLCEGTVLMASGDTAAGLALLDEAMCAVLAGELTALFTGWIFCLALPPCIEAADLRRAGEWTEAAMAWCDSLPAGSPFHGICRVHRVEVLHLRGAWGEAAVEARRACAELVDYDQRVAAEAFYVAGEIRRLGGDPGGAEEFFRRAHELGRDPQPGLAMLRLGQGRAAVAGAALRVALSAEGIGPVARARLLSAEVEVALALGNLDRACVARDELDMIAAGSGAALLNAMAAVARGAVQLAVGDPLAALSQLRRARTLWLHLGLPYPTAQTRMLIAAACRAVGDDEGGRLELGGALATFDRLGATTEAQRAAALLASGASRPGGLTRREVEVLRLVAAGRTNRSIAEVLVVSEHTVARHMNNIFTKLAVTSRAEATAYAFTHELV
jgi:DNA-binding CsgD family transcriptional regulator